MITVNEIFYSLQGEGCNSGTPAVFLRLAGCNLRCPFCDTDHSSGTPMSEEAIVEAVTVWPATLVVITGGEPALQLTATLVDKLHHTGRRIAIETNGTLPLPQGIDWITVSPKAAFLGEQAAVTLTHADELKVLFDGIHEPYEYPEVQATHRCLQPIDTGDPARNAAITAATVDYIKRHPQWRLSLQTHKILNIQ